MGLISGTTHFHQIKDPVGLTFKSLQSQLTYKVLDVVVDTVHVLFMNELGVGEEALWPRSHCLGDVVLWPNVRVPTMQTYNSVQTTPKEYTC